MTETQRLIVLTLFLCLIALIVAACGGSSDGAASSNTPHVVATMPPARFTAVAQQSAAQDTNVITKTDSLQTPTADASLSRGATIYQNKKCGDCHGAQGEGVASKGNALIGTPLTFQKFEDILRTGGNGSLGNAHLYGPSAISPSGMTNLYAFVTSLK